MDTSFRIDPDIRLARTLPAWFYASPEIYRRQLDAVFARSWQLAPLRRRVAGSDVVPWTLLEGALDEPVAVVADGETCRVLSNVCTHRGMIVVEEAGTPRGLRCRYHGRCFARDGTFTSMPGFEGVPDFPSPADDLPPLATGTWGPLVFASLDPPCGLDELLAPVRARVGWLPLDGLTCDVEASRDYPVPAGWALYCDNYLEGFHIPFVHPELAGTLDCRDYRVELFEHGSLQIGIAAADEPAFELPDGHPDAGQRVAGYYFFLFPNTMLNFYPWGLSVNVVEPRGPAATCVRYVTWVWRPELRGRGAGGDLGTVEIQDQSVVAGVQRGVRSRLYDRGRYSPRHEQAVHHFHCLLVDRLERTRPA